jgi:transcription initiation factor IIE alpha subunit
MPLISYLCEGKHVENKFYRQVKDAPASFLCPKCGKDMKKSLSAPSSSSKIVIDNGLQARAVEIIPDIVEINKERSEKNYKED